MLIIACPVRVEGELTEINLQIFTVYLPLAERIQAHLAHSTRVDLHTGYVNTEYFNGTFYRK